MEEYKVYCYGRITKFEAGVLYRAMKNNYVEVLPELITTIYDNANHPSMHPAEAYSQDRYYFDRVYSLTEKLLSKDFENAQKTIDLIQEDFIKNAGRKSIFFKYQ